VIERKLTVYNFLMEKKGYDYVSITTKQLTLAMQFGGLKVS